MAGLTKFNVMDRLLLVGPKPIAWVNPERTDITMFVIPAVFDYFKSFWVLKQLLSLSRAFIEKCQQVVRRFTGLVAGARPKFPIDESTPPVKRQCFIADRM